MNQYKVDVVVSTETNLMVVIVDIAAESEEEAKKLAKKLVKKNIRVRPSSAKKVGRWEYKSENV